MVISLSSHEISLDDISVYFLKDFDIELSEESVNAINNCRSYLENRLNNSEELIYGINTGFGSLCDVAISKAQREELQYNLIVSHACGQGEYVPVEIARLILLLKIKNMAFGYSGVRLELTNALKDLYNKKITPVIYQQGSLGASGDLAPLAHMSLPVLGLGEVWYEDKKRKTSEVLKELGLSPMSLSAKEGLALINGTQFSLSYATWSMYHAQKLMRWANVVAALSMEAFLCSCDPLDKDLHRIRQQKGQQKVSQDILELLEDSDLLITEKHSVQDPYSFRCVPQVHGATYDALEYAKVVIERELNAVTDNPNVFPDENKILSGGNFHAQPLALILDFMGIALAELGSISERRIYKLVIGKRGLPDYLTDHPGLHSGFMIPQYTAASIVSQNKQLCSPSSVDSITTSKGQEDHVSMAANAATKTYRIVENIYKVLAIELMTAAQALEFRKPYKCSAKLSKVIADYRERVPKLEKDRVLSPDIFETIAFIKGNTY